MLVLDVLNKMRIEDYTLMIFFVIIGLIIVFIQFRRKTYGVNRYGTHRKAKDPLLFSITLIALFIVWLATSCWYLSILEDFYN